MAILSVGASDGVRARRLRAWSARAGAFHYEADCEHDVADAVRTIGRVRPRLIALDGGDAAVGAMLSAGTGAPILLLPGRAARARGCALRTLATVAALDSDRLAARVATRRPLIVETGGRRMVGMTLGRRSDVETIVRIGAEGRTIGGRLGSLRVIAPPDRGADGQLKLVAVAARLPRLLHPAAIWAGLRLGERGGRGGLFVAAADMLTIEGRAAGLTLDGTAIAHDDAGSLRLSLGEPAAFVSLA